MKDILMKQRSLQTKYAKLNPGKMIDPSVHYRKTVGEVYDYIVQTKYFLNEEIDELLLELSDGDRAIHKPWSSRYDEIRKKPYWANEETVGEAIDALCFMMNILLMAGVHPNNIDDAYDKVYLKNRARQRDETY